MPSGTGYISEWTPGDEAGLIHVCAGDNLVNNEVAFPFDQCSSDLQATLQTTTINQAGGCPPPAGSLRVRFDFTLTSAGDLAINVRRI